MAFVRKKTKVYSWPVEVKTPSETEVGEFDTTSFTGKFVRLSRSELSDFESATEYEALKKVLVGWEDVNEEDGKPVEFNNKNLKEFAEDIDFVAGVLDAFKKFYANAQVGN
tara:strand:+ start:1767 stop:2099 length:333 start_codon:yes stop_codon:yes gene_type:complete